MLSDESFVKSFEDLSLEPHHFNHIGHIRLAWLYLNKYNQAKAIEKVLDGIYRYANHLGATDKFNYTLTAAILKIIAYRVGKKPANTLDEFLASNNDLVSNMVLVVNKYYSKHILHSDEAKRAFVEPDLKALPNSLKIF